MDPTMELLIRAHQGDKESRDLMVHKNMGLVWSVVRRYNNRGYDPEELFQVGSIGLLKAIDRFDLSYEVRFSTYAVPMIAGEIRRFLRDDGMLKVSRSMKETSARIAAETVKWQEQYGREATVEELADRLSMPVEDIVFALFSATPVDSLQQTLPGIPGKEITLEEQVPDPQNEIDLHTDRIFLEQLLSVLKKEERRLIYLRYFQSKTQSEVARILGISQVKVSRTEKRLLEKMRKEIHA